MVAKFTTNSQMLQIWDARPIKSVESKNIY